MSDSQTVNIVSVFTVFSQDYLKRYQGCMPMSSVGHDYSHILMEERPHTQDTPAPFPKGVCIGYYSTLKGYFLKSQH